MQTLKTDKQAEDEFLKLVKNIAESTQVENILETHEEKQARIKRLEADPEAWFINYFPKFSFAKPAPFQVASTARLVTAYRNMKSRGSGKFYQSRAWARGLAKSTRRMMEIFFLIFVEKLPANLLLISKSEANAVRLLRPYRANLLGNQKLINDYGVKPSGTWTAQKFVTENGEAFQAVGTDMNPRGSKEDELRINVLIFDDADDDARCRNAELLQQTWDWVEQSVIPCVEISRPYFILFDNNLIAEDSLAQRARLKANDKEIINIRDENGKSIWPEKNTEEMIEDMFENLSEASIQKEYYNNPLTTGKTFPEITWGQCPPLSELPFVVSYVDPSPSNRDNPGVKSGATNSRKAVFVIGRKGRRYYIYYGFLDIMGSRKLIESMYNCRDYVMDRTTGSTAIFTYIENNKLQDPVYSQIYLPLIYQIGEEHIRGVLGVLPDTREKPPKWFRIEATLEPINTRGDLIFNEEEKGNPHMQRLEAHFKSANMNSKTLDGPDCIEGGVVIIDQKTITENENAYAYIERERSSKYD